MTKNRATLQARLEELLGSRNVYYQPPESMKIEYPAIIYARKTIEKVHANNDTYGRKFAFELIFVRKNPEEELLFNILDLPFCRHDRHYKADNLNHDVFTIYW